MECPDYIHTLCAMLENVGGYTSASCSALGVSSHFRCFSFFIPLDQSSELFFSLNFPVFTKFSDLCPQMTCPRNFDFLLFQLAFVGQKLH